MNPFHTSESAEWYTPAYIMDYVRRVLGPIDLDPCTTPDANKVVKARKIYCAADDGLCQDWSDALLFSTTSRRHESVSWEFDYRVLKKKREKK